MDIYIDRTIEFGQLLPPGAPDLTLELGQHPFHLALPERPGESMAVRLRAATYCGVTDVLQFIAEVLPPGGSPTDNTEFEPRNDAQSTQLTMSNHLGRPTDQTIHLQELTADARRAALDLMQARQDALTEIDALQAPQPTWGAISRARHGHIDRAAPDIVRQAVERHRERASLEVDRLLQDLRNGGLRPAHQKKRRRHAPA